MKRKCPICKRPTDTLRSAIKNGVFLSQRCDYCLASNTGISDFARKYNRDRGREDYRRDIIQRFEGDKINEDFVRAYPEESRKQWGDQVLRDYGIKRKQF